MAGKGGVWPGLGGENGCAEWGLVPRLYRVEAGLSGRCDIHLTGP